MNYITVYKTSRSAGGLLVNGYYTDVEFPDWRDFWRFAPAVQDFDLAFSGSQTLVRCITCVPAGQGNKWARTSGRIWAPTVTARTGSRLVVEPLPWRWCLNVAWRPSRGPLHHHTYHDALDRSDVEYNHRGEVVLKWAANQRDIEQGRFGRFGASWPDWLMMGIGSGLPGQAIAHEKPIDLMPIGITVRNKARRAQAQLLKQGINFQGQVIGSLQAAAFALGELLILEDENTGHWIRGRLKSVTMNIMSIPIAIAKLHQENNKSPDGGKANNGDGFLTRYGPTGADIAGQVEFFEQKQKDDMKWLAKFPTFSEATGEEWFTNENAKEWFIVANDWAQYLGGFGYFDFLNPVQEGLQDMERLDNYTPFWPDLPDKVEGLPRPQKNRERRVPLPVFSV